MAATATRPASRAVGLPPGPPRLGPIHPLPWWFRSVQYVRECKRRFGPAERQRPRNVTLVPSRGARTRVNAVRA